MLVINKIIIAIFFALYFLASAIHTTQAKAVELGGDFTLTDHNEHKFELKQLRGNVVLVFFGYTSCPDICPTEMGKMAKILRAFEKKNDKVKGLFISVDPDRDSPQILKGYTSFFSNQLQGLTGSREEIDRIASQYGVHYQIQRNEKNKISVDHSSNIYVIDRKGELNTIILSGMTVNHVIDVVEWLLQN